MTKNEMEKHLLKSVNVSPVINEKILIIYKEDFKGIVELKKELRILTRKHEDFYKRNNGFYNRNIDIFLCNEKESIDSFLAITFFINSEEEAANIKDVMLKFINDFYNRTTCYTVEFTSDFLNYKVNKHELNDIEFAAKSEQIRYNKKSGIVMRPQDLFETELEAKREAYRIISAKVDEARKALRLLEETMEDIGEDVKAELHK